MSGQRKNLGAWTPPGPMPPYISINQFDNGDVEVTVRSEPHPDGRGYVVGGGEGTIRMTTAQFQALWLNTAKEFRA